MRKKETIILLDSKQSYRIIAYGCNRISIKPKLLKEMSSIGMLDLREKLVIKGW